jgi:hypothetical protein
VARPLNLDADGVFRQSLFVSSKQTWLYSGTAIQKTLDAAIAQGKSVWIPPGRFIVTGGISAAGVTIEGAGMWYSAVYRNLPLPVSAPLDTTMGNNLTADNNYVRGIGDDGVTINSDGTSQQMENPPSRTTRP